MEPKGQELGAGSWELGAGEAFICALYTLCPCPLSVSFCPRLRPLVSHSFTSPRRLSFHTHTPFHTPFPLSPPSFASLLRLPPSPSPLPPPTLAPIHHRRAPLPVFKPSSAFSSSTGAPTATPLWETQLRFSESLGGTKGGGNGYGASPKRLTSPRKKG